MFPQPPPLPSQKNLRMATALNVFLPGAGLVYLGERRAGTVLTGLFLGCFVAVMGIFLVGYIRYLMLALDPPNPRRQQAGEAGAGFHQSWLIALALAGGVVYLVSTVLFARAKRRFASANPDGASGVPPT
ncbi:MAG: hypothetical protein IPK15_07050 [Verrucomicrobia bacterium]|nr:hypothetical protein [Verrucomicrobiota bacterium]